MQSVYAMPCKLREREIHQQCLNRRTENMELAYKIAYKIYVRPFSIILLFIPFFHAIYNLNLISQIKEPKDFKPTTDYMTRLYFHFFVHRRIPNHMIKSREISMKTKRFNDRHVNNENQALQWSLEYFTPECQSWFKLSHKRIE